MTWELCFPENLPMVAVDVYRLNQVLTNLLSNAVKYTPGGGGITIEAILLPPPQDNLVRCPQANKGYVQVAIRDTGIGISPTDQERIFGWFVRLTNHPLVRATSGTGLGLTITRQLLHLQGGSIWVESAPGQGSTFFFTLPVAE